MTDAKVFTRDDPWPDYPGGTVVAVHFGDYRRQELWTASGANTGNWYPLGNEFGCPRTAVHGLPEHPHWEDIVARGPVTLLVPASADAYRAGWDDGRRRLLEQIEELRDAEWEPPAGAGIVVDDTDPEGRSHGREF